MLFLCRLKLNPEREKMIRELMCRFRQKKVTLPFFY